MEIGELLELLAGVEARARLSRTGRVGRGTRLVVGFVGQKEKAQVQAVHDVISRETQQFATDADKAPVRINELRLIEALMSAHLSN